MLYARLGRLRTLNARLSVASGGDEEKVCFYLKVLHS